MSDANEKVKSAKHFDRRKTVLTMMILPIAKAAAGAVTATSTVYGQHVANFQISRAHAPRDNGYQPLDSTVTASALVGSRPHFHATATASSVVKICEALAVKGTLVELFLS
jgi:hypothetical protein